MRKDKAPRILLTGGGTLGPVTPLLAIYEAWKKQESRATFAWIGTPTGPEKKFLAPYANIPFYPLFAPKLSRHEKWKWIFLPFAFLVSLVWAAVLVRKIKPDIIYTVGGFTSIPVFVVARFMKIPLWVHQLDVEPGLANKVMARLANRVTTTFSESAQLLPGSVCIGGMVRSLEGNADRAYAKFNLDTEKPTVLLMGGGTGAQQLNEAMVAIKEDVLPLANIIHSFGRGKMPQSVHAQFGYYPTELLTDDLADAYAASDVLIVRGGLGTLLEAVAWQKPIIMVPIEGSHQEANACVVEESSAGYILKRMTPQMLLNTIRKAFERRLEREAMARNMGNLIPLGAEEKIVAESKELLGL